MAKKKRAIALVQQAQELASRGETLKARNLARQATVLDKKNVEAWCLYAGTFSFSGEPREALRLIKHALDLQPDHLGAVFIKAATYHQMKHFPQALALAEKILLKEPTNPKALLIKADALLATGQMDDAATIYLRLLKQNPRHIEIYSRLEAFEPQTSALQKAGEALQALVAESKVPAEAYVTLSVLAHKSDSALAALDWANHAVQLNPQLARAHYALGYAYMDELHHDLAVESLRKAVELDPKSVDYQSVLARALCFSGRMDEGGELISRLYKAQPDNQDIVQSYGLILSMSGQHEEAQAVYRNVKQKTPMFYFELSQVARISEGDPVIEEIEQRLQAGQDPGVHSAFLRFALGKMYSDIGEYERSFAAYEQANKTIHAVTPHDESVMQNLCDGIIDIVDTAAVQADAETSSDTQLPVYIFGMPRSGTTLTETILGAHPEVKNGGELPLGGLMTRYLDSVVGEPYPAWMRPGALDPEVLKTTVDAMADDMVELAQGAKRVTDKLPHNFWYVGMLARFFPKARFIHVRRHPADTCLSIYFQMFGPRRHPYSWDQAELGRYYRHYEGLMDHWRSVLGDRLVEVRYEDLVQNRELETRRLVQACGLDWDDACLEDRQNDRDFVHTASKWQVRQAVYKTSMLRYKRYEQWLAPLLDALGDSVQRYEAELQLT